MSNHNSSVIPLMNTEVVCNLLLAIFSLLNFLATSIIYQASINAWMCFEIFYCSLFYIYDYVSMKINYYSIELKAAKQT
jgi:hypothetical protein